ncbi:MAG: hypothetical protein HYX90_01480 [Chloroflexi bacterium]|nr:hypothetical protein [Chloroflexota bacterium]
MQASAKVERLGIPTASIVCEGFVRQAHLVASALGIPDLPVCSYPGHILLQSDEELNDNVTNILVDQIVKGLTAEPARTITRSETVAPRDIVFCGTFEEVNSFFYRQKWSEGLPIVPPTVEKVEEFLRHTGRAADDVIGVLSPDKREATVWNIAVNGVMAGCRPEYMPVLVALVEAMADPAFRQEYIGTTSGTEAMITLNGPIIKDLHFNYEQGALRVGFQANTSIGRFWRLYLRNVAGFLPHLTDKATFGGTWRVVLAENEASLANIGWEPLSVDRGFHAGDNVVTVASCSSMTSVVSIGSSQAEEILDKLAAAVVDTQVYLFRIAFSGLGVRPQVVLSPCVAETIAGGGYSKAKVRQYLYEHALVRADRLERLCRDKGTLCQAVEEGKFPRQYCESNNPERMVPIVFSPDDFLVTVSGDPGRDNCLVCGQNSYVGYPVSKRIELPSNWQTLRQSFQE